MGGEETESGTWSGGTPSARRRPNAWRWPALALLWSEEEPGREGEVALIEEEVTLGRGAGEPGSPRATFVRQRPGRNEVCPPLAARRLSRTQLVLEPGPSGLHFRNVGKAVLQVNGAPMAQGVARPGDALVLGSVAFLVVERAPEMPAVASLPPTDWPSWGKPDRCGWVGESDACWALREKVAFAAGRKGHVLLLGESGSGKEVVARALHAQSDRAKRPLVARNAATIPEGIFDAEVFGNLKDYPNPGMRERPGLMGEADGSTLFLDEIAEIPENLQAHLLRVLDAGGEYHRLGESRATPSDVRLVAATNRAPESLKHDLLARFRLVIDLPGLPARREDVPLLLQHLLARVAAEDPTLRKRFFDADGNPRLDADLVAWLARWPYTHHVRELESLLWRAITAASGDRLRLPPGQPLASAPPRSVAPASLDAAGVAQPLAENDGALEATWRALGLKNRFQLIRLLKKHGLGRFRAADVIAE